MAVEITDFDPAQDAIVVQQLLNGTALDTPAEILALAVQSGSHTVINLGGANAVTLLDVQASSLTVANFLVVSDPVI